MKDWGKIEFGNIIVISTAHIAEKDAALLNKKYANGANEWHDEIDNEKHWINSLNIGTSEYGYFISVTSMKRHVDDNENVPDWIKDTLELCLDVGASWLHFDQDASEVDNLRVYEW